jgi:DNA-binding NarL/FixJ family response regulator
MPKILLIEDQPQMRENVALILELNGFDVTTAADGRQGVIKAREERPDLILCDVMMPELDGYGVLHLLRKEESMRAVPFIFLTAKGEKQEQRTGMNLGADDYLTKPCSEADLLSAIQVRLRRNRDISLNAAAASRPDFSSATPLETLGLTPREAEVLLWVTQGKSNADTASILGTSEATVRKHLEHIYPKLGIESRGAASLIAIETLSKAAAK